jgi:NAD(P)-dependent dehydrogenase (short-subunit alcohol dehydrogenase family)
MAQLTHPEWNHETGGLEVARAFNTQIKGKTGKPPPPQPIHSNSNSISTPKLIVKKTVLITGVSPSSIGSTTALSIASQSPSLLILASRTPSKLTTVQSTLRSAHPTTPTATIPLDLASQDSIRSAASAIAKLTPAIDLIINNAAVMTLTRALTPEGIELQFGANHIGHFLLTNLLLPQLLAAAATRERGATRVVNVTSLGHRLSPIRFHDYNFEGKQIPEDERPASLPPSFAKASEGAYNGYIAYGQAKSANVLFSVQVNKLLREKGVVSYAVHPGCKCARFLSLR